MTDDGLGVLSAEDSGGHGLAGMRERIAMYGGTVTAGPLPGGGFRRHRKPAVSPGPCGRRDRAGEVDFDSPDPADPVSADQVSAGSVSAGSVSVEAAIPVDWAPDPSLSGGAR